MKRILLVIIATLILSLVENSFGFEFLGKDLNPCLILALSFAFVMGSDDYLALLTGLIGGLFMDFSNTGIIGLSSILFIISIYISIFIKRSIFKGSAFQLVLVSLFSLVYRFLFNIKTFEFSFALLLGGVLTAFCSGVFFYLISKFSTKYLSVEYRIKA